MVIILGIIYTLVVTVGSLFYVINRNKENEEDKVLFKQSDELTYIDINGQTRFISDDELAFYTYNKNGDYVLENMSGYVYKNFSEEKRIKELNEIKKESLINSETTYCVDDNNHKNDWFCRGKRFKDFETGDIYVIRCIKCKYYYMNVLNGTIVRKTDYQIGYDEKMKNIKTYLEDLNIEEFNKKQKTVRNKNMLYRDFEYNSDCDLYK